MTTIAQSLRRAVALLSAVLLTALLSGCLIASETNLVGEDEGVLPFGPTLTVWTYNLKDGSYLLSRDEPAPFAADGKAYASGTGADRIVLQFVPRAGEGEYLVAVTGKDPGAYYGIGRLKDGIFALHLILSAADPKVEIEAIKAAAPADLAADMVIQDAGGIMVTRRATVDLLMDKIESGALTTGPLISFYSSDPSVTPPARIDVDGDWFKAE